MNKPRRNFDLPTVHFSAGEDYFPERTRDPNEAARRSANPEHTLILEQQAKGIAVMSATVSKDFTNSKDQNFVFKTVSDTAFNSDWYTRGKDSPLMRRVEKLPVLADDDAEWRETKEGLIYAIREKLVRAAVIANKITYLHSNGHNTLRPRNQLGNLLGSIATSSACVEFADQLEDLSEFDAQDYARLVSLDALKRARSSHQLTDVHWSAAQLSVPDAPLAIHWRRSAPETNQAHDAFVQAQRDFGLAA